MQYSLKSIGRWSMLQLYFDVDEADDGVDGDADVTCLMNVKICFKLSDVIKFLR